jgi:hypothetical protein
MCGSFGCCPPGTTFKDVAISYIGCCPDGDFCGCSEEFGVYCPISRRSAKTDIRYLTPDDQQRARDELLAVRLAEYRYRPELDPSGARHLGFIIDDLDDATARVCVQPDGEHVDLYGYASLAVAALQAQQREIDELRREIARLRELVGAPGATKPKARRKPAN